MTPPRAHDRDVPLTAFSRLRASSGPCVLLESVGAGTRPRLDLLAREPRELLMARRDGGQILRPDGSLTRYTGPPLQALRALLATLPGGTWPDEGGLVGALAYDAARPGPGAGGFELVALAVERFEVFVDHVALGSGRPAQAAWRQPTPGPLPGRSRAAPASFDLAAHSSLSPAAHRALVLRIQEHIAAGNIYQANLSQRFRLPWSGDGVALYAQLRRLSPAPFSGYLRVPGLEIVCSSPERLILVEGERLSTRPIAGTRPRHADPQRDEDLARELLLSEKERAEHLMLLDLARNDLGKVARIGSVHVDEMMVVESYSQVRHIVSNVSARLAPGHDALDALLAMFPGGTITGVPKIRCMQILDALEPVPRGFYTGALFYVTRSGRLDANILIRSATLEEGSLTFHTGGGIVADSDPDGEYQETLHKAEGLRLAIEAVLAG